MKGEISVQTQHIFPVIKRWLYSEKDIFLREIVSNACDAITKHKRLVSLAETEGDGTPYRIDVIINKDEKTLTVSDNGIGMNESDVDKYINKIALSGALDFIEKYEGKSESAGKGIIGHFGLGFYSAFMVSDTVELSTRSYDGSAPCHWSCDADGSFESEKGCRENRGTDVVMHLSEDELAYLDTVKVRQILDRYCEFMPHPIYLDKGDGSEPEQINDTEPLWQRERSEITPEKCSEFYKKQFNDFNDPLFSVYINADYPLNFKGLLFFPRPRNGYENIEAQVKLFYNQVFVADNIKEVIPDCLVNIKGVIDCPELPLNVSRSYLQTNTYVSKVSSHIEKKFADRINGLFNTEREELEKFWDLAAPYIRFACLKNEKFFDRIKDSILFANTDGAHVTLKEYFGLSENDEQELSGNVFYASSKDAQAYYIELLNAKDKQVLLLENVIDIQFTSMLERKYKDLKFIRVDSDISSALGSETCEAPDGLENSFRKAVGSDETKLSFSAFGADDAPAFLNISEESRRLAEMMSMYSANSENAFPAEETLVINTNSPMVRAMSELEDEKREKAARHVYLLALLAAGKLTAEQTRELIDIDVSSYKQS